jgi:hypothetical protein
MKIVTWQRSTRDGSKGRKRPRGFRGWKEWKATRARNDIRLAKYFRMRRSI